MNHDDGKGNVYGENMDGRKKRRMKRRKVSRLG